MQSAFFCTGRSGETIRQMSRASKTKIYIDRTQDDYRDKPKVVTISGAKIQIDVAKVGNLCDHTKQNTPQPLLSLGSKAKIMLAEQPWCIQTKM